MKVLAIAAVALCTAAPIEAQAGRAGVSIGYGGGGPAAIVAKTGSLDIHVWRAFGITAGIASLDHGNGVCNHRTPNRCDGGARTWALGAVHSAGASDRISVRSSIAAGSHDFSGIREGGVEIVASGPRPLVAGDIGAELRVIAGLGLHLTLQQTVVFDDSDYRAALDVPLRYRLLLLGVSYTL